MVTVSDLADPVKVNVHETLTVALLSLETPDGLCETEADSGKHAISVSEGVLEQAATPIYERSH